MFEPADNSEINTLQSPSDQGFYALIIGDILTESRESFKTKLKLRASFSEKSSFFSIHRRQLIVNDREVSH